MYRIGAEGRGRSAAQGLIMATRIQGYARRQVRAIDATPDRHHKETTADGSNWGGRRQGGVTGPPPRTEHNVCPVFLMSRSPMRRRRLTESATPSAFWQIREYAVVTGTGNQVRFEAMAQARNHRVG